jgi:aryl-alcohol dehydrogenase-like predicted oxidoreductase
MPPVRKLAKLPPELRTWLERTFVERAFGDIEGITKELNELMKRGGVAISVGKSAVGEESLRVRRAQEAIAAATRSMQLIADSARDDADKRGEALNAQLSTDLFEALLDASAAGAEEDPAERIKLLTKASLAAGRLTTTSVRQRAWRHQVEERAKAAAEAVEKIAKTGGMSAAQLREIKRQIMGITTARTSNEAPAGRPASETPATTA